jgi:hypothetical protein
MRTTLRLLRILLGTIALCGALGGCIYYHSEGDRPYPHYYGDYDSGYYSYDREDWRRHD